MLTKTPHLFDDATQVTAGDSRWQGKTSPDYWAFVGPFGGVTAATILRALIDHPQRAGDPLSLTVNFCAPIARRRVRSRRAPGQGQPLDAALVRGDVARRRRGRDAGDRRVRRAPAVLVAPAGGVSAAPCRSSRRALSQDHADDLDATSMISASSRASRAFTARLQDLAARRVLQTMDRRPRAAQDRHAVADVDVGRVFRPGVSRPARTDPVRHGVDHDLFPHRRRTNSPPRTSPTCWRWPTPKSSTRAMATRTANCGRRAGACSRPRRRSPISRRKGTSVRAA